MLDQNNSSMDQKYSQKKHQDEILANTYFNNTVNETIELADKVYTGDGIGRNREIAIKLYELAIENGAEITGKSLKNYINELYMLGDKYYNGYGVEQSYSDAFNFFRKAAEQGDADAQNDIGCMYYNGVGVEKDYSEAVNWFRKAAEQDNAYAQSNLGYMYQYGVGVEKDYSEAVIWYNKAAYQGLATGQYNLGYMYHNGYGVKRNCSEANKWLRKAADQGNTFAKVWIDYIDSPSVIYAYSHVQRRKIPICCKPAPWPGMGPAEPEAPRRNHNLKSVHYYESLKQFENTEE